MQWLQNATIAKQNSQLSAAGTIAEFVAKYFARNVVETTFRVRTLDVKVEYHITKCKSMGKKREITHIIL